MYVCIKCVHLIALKRSHLWVSVCLTSAVVCSFTPLTLHFWHFQLQQLLHLFPSRHLRDHLYYIITNASNNTVTSASAATAEAKQGGGGAAADGSRSARSSLYSKIGLQASVERGQLEKRWPLTFLVVENAFPSLFHCLMVFLSLLLITGSLACMLKQNKQTV